MQHFIPSQPSSSANRKGRYQAPSDVREMSILDLVKVGGRSLDAKQTSFFVKDDIDVPGVWVSGDLDVLKRVCVSVIGARAASEDGLRRAGKISQQLADAGVTIISGLAKGVDSAAHRGAILAGGRTAAVIGTPIDKCYPAENSELQEEIYRDHLLISQFQPGQRTFPSDFPKRNRLMAALTDASIIVEAKDTSGTLHQASECLRLGRWLFIMQSVADDPSLSWPAKFLGEKRVRVLTRAQDVLDILA